MAEQLKNVEQQEIIDQAFEKMRLARQNFLLNNPFFAMLSLRQELVEASNWLGTMAVDGKHLFFNAKFALELTIPEIHFVIGHEILHLAYGHLSRHKQGEIYEMDMDLFNQACDYCVNRDLFNSNIGQMPKKALYDKKYEHYIAEEIFKEMLNEPEKHKQNKTLDEHLDLSGDQGNGNGQSPQIEKDKNGNKRCNHRPVFDEKSANQNLDKFTDDLMIANEEVKDSDGAGDIPAGLQRIINELTKPKINWKHYLKKMIQSQLKNDLNWARGSRRSFDSRFHFPSDDDDQQLSVHIGIDTSASMTDAMLRDFLSEVYGIMQQFTNFKIDVWTFDTNVYNHKSFNPDNARKVKNYQVIGHGGTDYMANWHYMKEKGIQPDLLVLFTDGMPCGEWGEKNFCETLYIIHSNPSVKAPTELGKTVYYP